MPQQQEFQRTLVTSALPYANGHIHLGHIAGAYLPADIYVRYLRQKGQPVLYIGGSDEHGVPITLSALKKGVNPQDVIDEYHHANVEAFAHLGISYDLYGRTSWPLHQDTTQRFFKKLEEGGYIFTEAMELWYSEASDRFLPDRYVRGTCPKCGYEEANGDECENCGAQYHPQDLIDPRANIPGDSSQPILRDSRHWFLNLPAFQAKLKSYLDEHPEWRPNVRGIATGWIDDLRARCITRDTDWGVPIPVEDPDAAGKRIYVWFDAPIGYVTNTRQWSQDHYNDDAHWQAWWQQPDSRIVHFIGKDNVPFHAVIFPAMLMGQEDYTLADQVVGNEYLNVYNRQTGKAEKGSKSRGNMISVRWALEKLGPDIIRYYLCAIAPESRDAAFDWDDLLNRYNGELCDVVGNFVHRSLTMTVKNFDGQVPPAPVLDDADQAMLDAIPVSVAAIGEALETFRFRLAIEKFIDLGRQANVYFDQKQPWVTRKTDLERTGTTLHICCQVVKALCHTMAPFLPESSHKLAAILDIALPQGGPEGGDNGWDTATKHLAPGHTLNTPKVLFPKIDPDYLNELAEAHQEGEAF